MAFGLALGARDVDFMSGAIQWPVRFTVACSLPEDEDSPSELPLLPNIREYKHNKPRSQREADKASRKEK